MLKEKAGRQLVEDRRDYGSMLQMKAEMTAQRTKTAGMGKMMKDQAKALAVGNGSHEFSVAQKQHIVEIDSSGVDFSTLMAVNLGSGVTGSKIDLSL